MTRETWLQKNGVLAAVAVALLVFVSASVLWQFWLAPTVFTENAEAGQNIAEDTISSEKALNDYREFRSLWNEIEAQHEQTQNYKDSLERFYEIQGENPDEWSREAEVRHGRIQQRITGSQNQEEMLISEYNAMSEDATTSLYKCHLPNSVQSKLFITDGAGVEYEVDDPPETAPKAENVNGEGCKFAQDPEEATEG